jgi:hypothetical protein
MTAPTSTAATAMGPAAVRVLNFMTPPSLHSGCLAMSQVLDPAAMPEAPLRPAAGRLHYGACHLPATQEQEAQGGRDRTKQRAYTVPGRNCFLNASCIKALEKREDHEGGLHPCVKTR